MGSCDINFFETNVDSAPVVRGVLGCELDTWRQLTGNPTAVLLPCPCEFRDLMPTGNIQRDVAD